MRMSFLSYIPTYAHLGTYNNKNTPYSIVSAEAKNEYSLLDSKSSYLHVISWSIFAMMILCIIYSTLQY